MTAFAPSAALVIRRAIAAGISVRTTAQPLSAIGSHSSTQTTPSLLTTHHLIGVANGTSTATGTVFICDVAIVAPDFMVHCTYPKSTGDTGHHSPHNLIMTGNIDTPVGYVLSTQHGSSNSAGRPGIWKSGAGGPLSNDWIQIIGSDDFEVGAGQQKMTLSTGWWYDKWTKDGSGTIAHIVMTVGWPTGDRPEVEVVYFQFDTATDTIVKGPIIIPADPQDFDTGSAGFYNRQAHVCKHPSGRISIIYKVFAQTAPDGSMGGFHTSDDDGSTWTVRDIGGFRIGLGFANSVGYGMFPSYGSDDEDDVFIVTDGAVGTWEGYDNSEYDASADTWSHILNNDATPPENLPSARPVATGFSIWHFGVNINPQTGVRYVAGWTHQDTNSSPTGDGDFYTQDSPGGDWVKQSPFFDHDVDETPGLDIVMELGGIWVSPDGSTVRVLYVREGDDGMGSPDGIDQPYYRETTDDGTTWGPEVAIGASGGARHSFYHPPSGGLFGIAAHVRRSLNNYFVMLAVVGFTPPDPPEPSIIVATPLREDKPPPGVYIYDGSTFRQKGKFEGVLEVERNFIHTSPAQVSEARVTISSDDPLLAEMDPLGGDLLVVISGCYPLDWAGPIIEVSQSGRDAVVEISAMSMERVLQFRYLSPSTQLFGVAGQVFSQLLGAANTQNPTGLQLGALESGARFNTSFPDWTVFDAMNSVAEQSGLEWYLDTQASKTDIEFTINLVTNRGFDWARKTEAIVLAEDGNLDMIDWRQNTETAAFNTTVIGGRNTGDAAYATRPRGIQLAGGGGIVSVGVGAQRGAGDTDSLVASDIRSFQDGMDRSGATAKRLFGRYIAAGEFNPQSPIGRKEVQRLSEELRTSDFAAISARVIQERGLFDERLIQVVVYPDCNDWTFLRPGNVLWVHIPSVFLGRGWFGPARIKGVQPAEADGELDLALVPLRENQLSEANT